jgi:hypothetical protein
MVTFLEYISEEFYASSLIYTGDTNFIGIY